jgi:hypothetical protein
MYLFPSLPCDVPYFELLRKTGKTLFCVYGEGELCGSKTATGKGWAHKALTAPPAHKITLCSRRHKAKTFALCNLSSQKLKLLCITKLWNCLAQSEANVKATQNFSVPSQRIAE